MAVTVRQLAAALRLITDLTADPPEPQLAILTRLLGVGDAFVSREAPDAPEAVQDEAVIRFASYLYDQPSAGRGDSYGNAWRNSGAASLVTRWIERRASLQAETGTSPGTTTAAVDEAEVLAIIEEWAAEQSAYAFHQAYDIADPAIASDVDVPAAGYEIVLIAQQVAVGGIVAGEDFISQWYGTLEVDLDYDAGNNKQVDFELHFNHTIRKDGVPLSFDAVRTVHYRINKQSVFTIPLNVFDSRSVVPIGEYTLQNGTTITLTQEDLDGELTISASLVIKSQGDDATIETLNIERGQAVFHQLGRIGQVAAAPTGDKGPTGDPGSGNGGGANVEGLEHRLDVVEAKTADLAAGAEPGAFATVTDVAAQGGLSASRSTRPSLQQAQTISAYAAKRNPSTDSGIYVVRLPITVDKGAYQVSISPGELSGLQAYTLPAGAWHRLGADESYQYFYFPYPYRIAEVSLQVAANADHIGSSAYHGHVLDAQLLDRIQNLARLTADLQQGNLPAGWSTSSDAAIAGVAFGDADLTAARAASYALSVSGGGNLLIRVRRSDDPSQFRVRYSTTQGDLAYRSLHELRRLGSSAGDTPVHDYYFGGNILAATHESITVEVTGTAAHAGTSKYRGVFDGIFEDGIVDLDALAAAVAARLLPTGGANGKFLGHTSGAPAWVDAPAGGGGDAPAGGGGGVSLVRIVSRSMASGGSVNWSSSEIAAMAATLGDAAVRGWVVMMERDFGTTRQHYPFTFWRTSYHNSDQHVMRAVSFYGTRAIALQMLLKQSAATFSTSMFLLDGGSGGGLPDKDYNLSVYTIK